MENNIRISAVGGFGAGHYNSIFVTGVGACMGQKVTAKQMNITGVLNFTGTELVEAEQFTCPGVCELPGILNVVNAKISGKTAAGEIHADNLAVGGQLNIKDRITAASTTIRGRISAGGLVECGEIDVAGELRAAAIQTGKADVSGVASISGTFEAGKAKINGVLKARSGEFKTIEANGCIEIKEKLICSAFKGGGTVRARNVEADSFLHGGSSHIDNQLSADKVDIAGCIDAKEIVGDQIKVGRPNKNFFIIYKNLSRAELIEGTTIELYYVKAKQVNGQNIVIGKKCEVESVDCSGTLSIAPDATVGNITGNYRRI